MNKRSSFKFGIMHALFFCMCDQAKFESDKKYDPCVSRESGLKNFLLHAYSIEAWIIYAPLSIFAVEETTIFFDCIFDTRMFQ